MENPFLCIILAGFSYAYLDKENCWEFVKQCPYSSPEVSISQQCSFHVPFILHSSSLVHFSEIWSVWNVALWFHLRFCFHCHLFSKHWKVVGLSTDCCPYQKKLFRLKLLIIYVCKHKHRRLFYSITMSKIIISSILWPMNPPPMSL